MTTFSYPYALEAIGWKMYMINGAWDIIELCFVAVYWVETKGLTLEEIDKVLDGEKHSQVPDLEDYMKGKVDAGHVLTGIELSVGVSAQKTNKSIPVDTAKLD